MRPDGSRLVGSVSPMIAMVRTMVQAAGVSVAEAVRMASLSPARALGISSHKGSLEARKDADLVLFTDEFRVLKTIVGGHLEYEAA
jgi:N-acetylglucosamine-6-phosphate deacetylase